jgi:DNA-binding IclR family transcriptional regulator
MGESKRELQCSKISLLKVLQKYENGRELLQILEELAEDAVQGWSVIRYHLIIHVGRNALPIFKSHNTT